MVFYPKNVSGIISTSSIYTGRKKTQQDANVHLHANDILQPCDNQDLEHSCTWKGKRNGGVPCVFVFDG